MDKSPMRMTNSLSRRGRLEGRLAGGASLIEVLISVLILGVGILGIAAMQATALRNSQSALERSQAVIQSYAMLDAMRANLAAARGGLYDMGMTCAPPAVVGLPSADQARWIASLQGRAGTGQTSCGSVTCNAAQCTVTVRWDDSRGRGGDTNQQFSTVTRL